MFSCSRNSVSPFLAIAKDCGQIERKLKYIIALTEKKELELNSWLDLETYHRSELIIELLSSIKDYIQEEQTMVFKSISARQRWNIVRECQHSIKSTNSGSSRSWRESFLIIKAKRAVLEEQIKFTNKIEEQQRILNKLKMQQEFNELLAAEAIYEEFKENRQVMKTWF